MNNILKIGHRGAKGHEPENTLISFEKALEMQVHAIELDVHLSSDRVLMVIHDDNIDRTTNGTGAVTSLTLSELKKFKINDVQKIPTLKEVFDLVNQQCFINIELKGIGTAKQTVLLIEEYVSEKNWNYSQFIISSFDWNALQEVNSLNPEIPIGILTNTDIDLAFAFAKFIKATSIHPYFHLLNHENTKQIQEEGFLIYPWTVNELEDIKRIKSLNVNGIITDFPDRL